MSKRTLIETKTHLSTAKLTHFLYVFNKVLAADNFLISQKNKNGIAYRKNNGKKILSEALASFSAEFLAVFGRRRVGKTFLIRSVFQKQLIFELSGVHDANATEQLLNFSKAIADALGSVLTPAAPKNWTEAFWQLSAFATPIFKKRKAVISFDEFPWLSSHKSGFLTAFEYFWNQWASQQPNLIVAICGSTANWMIKKVVNSKGGLHNRLKRKIRLLPFTLHETEQYLISNNIHIHRYQVLIIFMAMGGVPHYLKELKKGESTTQAIDRLCFTKDGLLSTEFANLYRSLFENADRHISVVKALADKPSGLTRNEIIRACNLQSGGTTSLLLEELVESGFITRTCLSRRMPIKAFTNSPMNTAFSTLNLLNIPPQPAQAHV